MTISISVVPSPLGRVVIAAHEVGVCVLEFENEWPRAQQRLRRTRTALRLLAGADPCRTGDRIHAYFDGQLDAFDRLPLDPHGTPFEQRVWA